MSDNNFSSNDSVEETRRIAEGLFQEWPDYDEETQAGVMRELVSIIILQKQQAVGWELGYMELERMLMAEVIDHTNCHDKTSTREPMTPVIRRLFLDVLKDQVVTNLDAVQVAERIEQLLYPDVAQPRSFTELLGEPKLFDEDVTAVDMIQVHADEDAEAAIKRHIEEVAADSSNPNRDTMLAALQSLLTSGTADQIGAAIRDARAKLDEDD